MPLFGRSKDRNLIKSFNKEILYDWLDTKVVVFVPFTNRSNTNIYGEGSDGYKKYKTGIEMYATVNTADQEWSSQEFGVDINQKITFGFLNELIYKAGYSIAEEDDEDRNYSISPGDVVYYDSNYWEIDSTNRNQYLFGRNEYNTDASTLGDTNISMERAYQ